MIRFNKLLGIIIATTLCLIPGVVIAAEPSLLFDPSSTQVDQNQEFSIDIVLETGGQKVSGAGAQIIYDPSYLEAKKIDPSDVFVDYPATIIDKDNGRISISGIVSSPTDFFNGKAAFASITFKSIKTGTTQVKFMYSPGSTTDSNIAVMSDIGDILSEVNILNVTIAQPDNSSSTSSNNSSSSVSDSIRNIQNSTSSNIKKISSTLGLSSSTSRKIVDDSKLDETSTTDPMAPIVRQPPITEPSPIQPTAPAPERNVIIALLIVIIILLMVIIGYFIFHKKKSLDTVTFNS